jgi:hypothetical protein
MVVVMANYDIQRLIAYLWNSKQGIMKFLFFFLVSSCLPISCPDLGLGLTPKLELTQKCIYPESPGCRPAHLAYYTPPGTKWWPAMQPSAGRWRRRTSAGGVTGNSSWVYLALKDRYNEVKSNTSNSWSMKSKSISGRLEKD